MSDTHAADAVGDERLPDTPDTVDAAIEDRARLSGWKPKDEFRGDPARWTDATTFVERGEKILPIVLERNRALEDKLSRITDQLGEVTTRQTETAQAFVEYRDFARKSEERSYQRAKAELEARMNAAVDTADRDTYQRAKAELDQLERPPAAAAADKSEAPKQQPQVDPVVREWVGENDWFNRDPTLGAFATALHGRLLQEKPGLSLRENLAEVRKEIVARFPEKFGNPKREAPAAVASPTAASKKSKIGKSFDDLPGEAKSACDRYIKMINAGNPKTPYTREEYVRMYYAGEE